MANSDFRLTALAHGGGCGCKLSPAVLQDLLTGMPAMTGFPQLLVGTQTSDDAAVYQISDTEAVVSTTDFFLPIVDDPYDFGRIAAANALSDIYAMGARPLMALAILGMPLGKIEPEAVRRILAGGASVCKEAGIPVAGGHSIDTPEPIYGLAVTGLVHPDHLLRNSGAKPGDLLVLTKPLGVGILSAALKSDRLDEKTCDQAYLALIETTTKLNSVGTVLANLDSVHAMTDVTGFGLGGHALEVCRASNVAATITTDSIPMLSNVAALAQSGCRTGAATRNWASYGHEIGLAPDIAEWQRDIVCDPQTSGGLLISVAPDGLDSVMTELSQHGFDKATVIGTIHANAADTETFRLQII